MHRAGSGLDDIGQHRFDVRLSAGCALGRVRSIPDDGQDGALHRCQHRSVGDLGTLAQALRQVEAVGAPTTIGTLGHTADDLRQDDAAVAASAGQRTSAERVSHAIEVTLAIGQLLGLDQG